MKKNNPARRAGDKNNLAPILSKKNRPGPKVQAPPPEYQMDRALEAFPYNISYNRFPQSPG